MPHQRDPRGRCPPAACWRSWNRPGRRSAAKLFDVFGKLEFEGQPLRELLLNAIRYGEQPGGARASVPPSTKRSTARRCRTCSRNGSSFTTAMDATRVQRVRDEMERAEARRLQPHYIESFFREAFHAAPRAVTSSTSSMPRPTTASRGWTTCNWSTRRSGNTHQAVLPGMRERGWGRIVAIASIGARQPIGTVAASSLAHAGVSSFLKTLSAEVAGDGATVNSAQPGIHATDRITSLGNTDAVAQRVPTGKLASAEDFGKAVAFLCSDPATFITSYSILLDGGVYRRRPRRGDVGAPRDT